MEFSLRFAVFACVILIVGARNENSDVGLNVVQLIQKRGYPIETHRNIHTQDGYLLTLHRIPHGKILSSSYKTKPVALLVPCYLCSAAEWVTLGPNKSLSYILSDFGYDVWMVNPRGTTWSRKHINLDPDKNKPQFWNFDYHEMGVYDLPASIDYVLNQTKQEKLFYVGYSQGTVTFFVMGSERPEYNSKIRLMIALAPVASLGNFFNPMLRAIAPYHSIIASIAKSLGFYEFVRHYTIITELGRTFCKDESLFQEICAIIMYSFGGFTDQLNKSLIPVITSNTPAGASIKQFEHFGQGILSGKFQQFDYGIDGNMQIYGKATPPDYNLKNVTAPVAAFYSENDWLASPKDVEVLCEDLPNLVMKHLVQHPKFNHLDFVWATDIVPLLYTHVIKLLEQF